MNLLSRNNYDLIKENLGLILLVPTLLGGYWQILSLSFLLGIPYLRFFSISQAISDGIVLMIIFLIVFYLIYTLTNNIFVTPRILGKYGKYVTFFIVIIDLILIIFLVYILYSNSDRFENELLYYMTVIMGLLIFVHLVIHVFSLCDYNYTSTYFSDRKVRYYLLIVFLIILHIVLINFTKKYPIPENLGNMNYIKCYINNNYPDNVGGNLIYRNDKYIFFEIIEGKKQIEAIKYDELLNPDNCK